MNVLSIEYSGLFLAFFPVVIVLIFLFKWSLSSGYTLYGFFRMFIQLLLIGYVLSYIFESDRAEMVLIVLVVMVLSSSWIALGSVKNKRRELIGYAFLSIVIGGGLTLLLISQAVLRIDPWYMPKYLIPLAGMIFANAMNSISLTAERLTSELQRGDTFEQAKKVALKAALIPITNSLFAVGLVSLPGMMTGQILSGVSPHIAAKYQIMVMCMLFSSSGMSAICFLKFSEKSYRS